jgi:F-type H+/Na+-transporting ATPase subunit beta
MTGKVVELEDALTGCERILSDEFYDRSESDLYMLGKIGEIKSKTDNKQESEPEPESEPQGDSSEEK